MKLMKAMTFFLAAGAFAALQAQQPADPNVTLDAIAQMKSEKKPGAIRLVQPSAVGKGILRYMELGKNADGTLKEDTTKNFKVLMIMTPPELVAAQRAYAEGDLNSAKKQLAAVRAKYEVFSGLPESPSLQAALMELRCLARLQDWSGLGKAVEKFPYPRFQDAADRAVLDAARLLSMVSDDPATAGDREKELLAFMADSGKMKYIHTTEYGWLKYALGRALASGSPDAAKASRAVDAYCEAAVCYRGGEMELAEDAMKRAFHLLWDMPNVKSYGTSAKKMDVKKWNAAPSEFRDAVSLANFILLVVNPEVKDDAVRQAASYFVNVQEGKKPAEK